MNAHMLSLIYPLEIALHTTDNYINLVCEYAIIFSLCVFLLIFVFMYENFLKACGCINVTSVTAISGNRP